MPILVLVIAGFAILAILRYQALIGRNGRLRHPFVAHSNGVIPMAAVPHPKRTQKHTRKLKGQHRARTKEHVHA